jgi:cytochrome d ubiquinol oxidase subunit I
LAHNNVSSAVRGIKDLEAEADAKYGPGDYTPPVAWIYWTFRVMVGLGLWWRGRLGIDRRWQRVAMASLFLPFIANTAGWMVTELGRQPWVVYGVLRTADGVSPNVGSASVWITMIGFTLVYGLLAVVGAFLMHRFARPGSEILSPGGGEHAHLDASHAY